MKNTFLSEGIKDGLIMGLVFTLITVVIYIIDVSMFGGMTFGLSIFAIYLILIIVFNIRFRKSLGGFWSFKEAFMYNFSLLLCAGLISVVVNIVLFNIIDPEAPKLIAENTVESTINMVEKMGGDPSDIEDQLDETYDNTINQFSTVGQLKGFGFALIAYAIFGAIFAAIFKKNKPQEEYI
ncbi:DUF4199 domain-containing protein [Marinigracilibium pacificum]|uniref:DUF4199 domain-containing protein n=1 Tax=Marinigracilibium pacificum TaxID=2729599 RepID=A0A848J761_9BACT|nr:DUF4199 domain-containing protein [Marinigracilibium pacificum]NMM50274.1 DUF4199 domain-containing protein [Marinigracilibium pacificum]